MSAASKCFDFIKGAFLVGVPPVLSLFSIGFVSYFFRVDAGGSTYGRYLDCLFWAAAYVAPVATLYFVARWRLKHRLLPRSFIVAEILFGLPVAGAVLFFALALWGFSHSD